MEDGVAAVLDHVGCTPQSCIFICLFVCCVRSAATMVGGKLISFVVRGYKAARTQYCAICFVEIHKSVSLTHHCNLTLSLLLNLVCECRESAGTIAELLFYRC